MLQVTISPKLPYCREIYMRFGRDYGRGFVDHECALDLKSVISENEKKDLLSNTEKTEQIVENIVQRISDAAAFHKIEIEDISVTFRKPRPSE